jgi:hypothetical protein
MQSRKKNDGVPNERTKDIEGMGEHVSHMQNREEKLDEKSMSHNIEVAKNIIHAGENEKKSKEEEREEELVDFEDTQDKLVEQEEEEMLESQESFNTKVQEIIADSRTREELIEVKMENEKNKIKMASEEPRRCSRLRDQEDVDRTELAMKRAAKKNEILGNDNIPT